MREGLQDCIEIVRSFQEVVVGAAVDLVPQLGNVQTSQLADNKQMCEDLALSYYLLQDFQALLLAFAAHQCLHLGDDILLLLKLLADPQVFKMLNDLLVGLFRAVVLIIRSPYFGDLFLLQKCHITFSCSLHQQPKHLLFLSEPPHHFSFTFLVILGPRIGEGADLMEPVYDHKVALALEDQCLKLSNIKNVGVQLVLQGDFVDKSSPDFDGVKDQLILTLSLAILLQYSLVLRVQLVHVDIGKVLIQPLRPGIRKVRGLLEQCCDLPAEVLLRLLVLGVDLGVVEKAEVGGTRGREWLLLGLYRKRWAHCLKLSFQQTLKCNIIAQMARQLLQCWRENEWQRGTG